MKILCDTSILVEIDRHNESVVRLLKSYLEKDHELVISTITVAEILTGAFLNRKSKDAVLTAKEILNQFTWIAIDSETAETAAELSAALFIDKKQDHVEYQDVLIAASALRANADILLTLNKKDFVLFSSLKDKIHTPEEVRHVS